MKNVLQAAEEAHQRLSQGRVFGEGVRCALLHGRMPPEAKTAVVGSFVSGETPILIATTVVEASLFLIKRHGS